MCSHGWPPANGQKKQTSQGDEFCSTTCGSLEVAPSPQEPLDENAARPHLDCSLVKTWGKGPSSAMSRLLTQETVR